MPALFYLFTINARPITETFPRAEAASGYPYMLGLQRATWIVSQRGNGRSREGILRARKQCSMGIFLKAGLLGSWRSLPSRDRSWASCRNNGIFFIPPLDVSQAFGSRSVTQWDLPSAEHVAAWNYREGELIQVAHSSNRRSAKEGYYDYPRLMCLLVCGIAKVPHSIASQFSRRRSAGLSRYGEDLFGNYPTSTALDLVFCRRREMRFITVAEFFEPLHDRQ
ncbi:hypothetical protein M413DRAFT_30507 [Hebeloma cylindrosporum]|uniref:Uncharacterized protein n=1 Tax=Hebeloma cylindrosporum TaxID=76867 RepID=A0A0C3BM99_HEBCY|nr:hypothetical protein M413DRAFT_30507 [Hebeloma cylindrosporum h7]